MAGSSLEARREARRRKVLDNSEDRLQQIFGKQEKKSKDLYVNISNEHGTRVEEHHQVLPNSPETATSVIHSNHSSSVETTISEDISFLQTGQLFVDCEVPDEDGALNLNNLLGKTLPDKNVDNSKELQTSPLSFKSLISRRFHIVILALLARVLFAFDYGYLFGENVLLPFFIVQLTEMLTSVAGPTGSSGMIGAALLLCGIIPRKVTFISNIFNRTARVLQNLCLYLFFFILFYAILEWPG